MIAPSIPVIAGLTIVAVGILGCGPADERCESIARPALDEVEDEVRAAVEEAAAAVAARCDDARTWSAYGDRLAAHGWRADAHASYLTAEELESEEFLWPYLAGAMLAGDDPARAIPPLRRALALDGAYVPARVRLAEALSKSGEIDEAKTLLDEVLVTNAAHARARVLRAGLALNDADMPRVVELIEPLLDSRNLSKPAAMQLSQALRAVGRDEDARRIAALAPRLADETTMQDPRAASRRVEPAGAKAHNDAGRSLLRAGRLREAEPYFVHALDLREDYAEAHYNLGTTQAQTGRLAQAIVHFERAVELRPGLVAARANLGAALAELGRFDEALQQLETAHELAPDDGQVLFNLASMQAETGALATAADSFERAFELSGNPRAREASEQIRAQLSRQ